jgi:NAD(P)-dependent dehydrogenase (short-subunit alcohol dehydrogenase family)
MFREGSVAVVTGVGPGMGRSVALGLARRGVDLALGGLDEDTLGAVADEVRALGRDALVVPTDITDPDACNALIDAAVDHFGGVDILVQNAHHPGDWKQVADADPASWRSVFEVNLYGALHLVGRTVAIMRERGGGSIVLVNSGAALLTPKRMGAYSASKAALATLTRTLAKEVGQWNIRVNGVYLGSMMGETLVNASAIRAERAGLSVPELLESRAASAEFPMGLIPTPEQCTGAVLFFVSDLASPVTGQHLSVNAAQWTT